MQPHFYWLKASKGNLFISTDFITLIWIWCFLENTAISETYMLWPQLIWTLWTKQQNITNTPMEHPNNIFIQVRVPVAPLQTKQPTVYSMSYSAGTSSFSSWRIPRCFHVGWKTYSLQHFLGLQHVHFKSAMASTVHNVGTTSDKYLHSHFWSLSKVCQHMGREWRLNYWCAHMEETTSVEERPIKIHTYIHTYIHVYIHSS